MAAPMNTTGPGLPLDSATGSGAEVPYSKEETGNPPVDEETRKLFAQHGIFQDKDGTFYKDSKPLKKPNGAPMTAEEVRATLPDTPPQGSAPQGSPNAEADRSNMKRP